MDINCNISRRDSRIIFVDKMDSTSVGHNSASLAEEPMLKQTQTTSRK